jgi:hypothetical protein
MFILSFLEESERALKIAHRMKYYTRPQGG